MKIVNDPTSTLIKPYNLYTYDPDVKEYFLNRFVRDELSFTFLHELLRYCAQFNEGEWTTVTPAILQKMERSAKKAIPVQETYLFKKGYLVQKGAAVCLTHEFIVTSYMCCADGNFIPLSGGHIDFSGTEQLTAFLKDTIRIPDERLVSFLVSLALQFKDKKGTLLDAEINAGMAGVIAQRAGIIPAIHAIDLGHHYGLISFNEHIDGKVLCNGLLWAFYLASPANV